MDAVEADIPALLALDVFDRETLIADTVAIGLTEWGVTHQNSSFFYFGNCHMPLFRSKSGHVYVEMDCSTSMMFTRSQLNKLHKQFIHPFTVKLFNFPRKARPDVTFPETLAISQDLSNRYDSCQRIHNAPTRSRDSFGTEIVWFKERIFWTSSPSIAR